MPDNERCGVARQHRIFVLLILDKLYYLSISSGAIADSHKYFEAGINEVNTRSSETVSVYLDITLACYSKLLHEVISEHILQTLEMTLHEPGLHVVSN